MHKGLILVGLVTAGLLAGCGGGGGGSSANPPPASSSLTVNTDPGVTKVTVAPAASASAPCGAGVTTTSGQFIVSTSQCGGQPLTVTTDTGEVNNYIPGQSTTVDVNSTTTADIKAYAGSWTVNYTGSDSGSCSYMTISSTGLITASACTSKSMGRFTLTGGLDSNGVFTGSATTGAIYSGKLMTSATGSSNSGGVWTNAQTGGNGTWTATMVPATTQ